MLQLLVVLDLLVKVLDVVRDLLRPDFLYHLHHVGVQLVQVGFEDELLIALDVVGEERLLPEVNLKFGLVVLLLSGHFSELPQAAHLLQKVRIPSEHSGLHQRDVLYLSGDLQERRYLELLVDVLHL